MQFSILEIDEIFAEAHFVAVDLIGIQPDAMLREFRIIKLRSHPVWIVIPGMPQRNGPSGMQNRRRRDRDVGDRGQMFPIPVWGRRGARGKGNRMKPSQGGG